MKTNNTQFSRLILTTFMFFALIFVGISQIIITEIMYNPPESGSDSLEYIELYNNSDTPIDMSGYSFSNGVVYAFENFILEGKSFVVVAVNATVMMNTLGVTAFEWTSGGLRNSGELISIVNTKGETLDSVLYDDVAPWPIEPDGDGYSLELCNVNTDNGNAKFWKASRSSRGIKINDIDLFASPGADNIVTCADHQIIVKNFEFDPSEITIKVGESIEWKNIDGSHNVNGSLATFPNNPKGFRSGDAMRAEWSFIQAFDVVGDYDYQCDPHANNGMAGIVHVVEDVIIEIPSYNIDIVTTNNQDGVADSNGVECKLKGIVYGVDLQVNDNLQFTIIDQTGGINVFGNQTFGYTVNEGDEIEITGRIGQFNGLTQINAEGIKLISTNNNLISPKHVTDLDETTEGEFIQMLNMQFVDTSQWQSTGRWFSILISDENNKELTMYIDDAVDLSSMTIPQGGLFAIRGIGGQFDRNAPYDEGYQIAPRSSIDVQPMLSVKDNKLDLLIDIVPNPVLNEINVITDENISRIDVISTEGKILLSTNSKSLNMVDFDTGFYLLKVSLKDGRVYNKKIIKL